MPERKPLAERFWEKVDKNGPLQAHMETNCWIWTGAVCGHGRHSAGIIRINGKNKLAYRVALMLAGIEIPADHEVCHRCDNRLCVRESHLFLGTHQENMYDRNSKGRARGGSLPGEAHPNHSLTEAQITEIKELYASGEFSQYQLADRFSVTQGHISNIVRGKRRPVG